MSCRDALWSSLGEALEQLSGRVTALEQLSDVRASATDRIQRGDPLQGWLAGDVEDHRVPRRGHHIRGIPAQAAPAEVCPGVGWRFGHGPNDLGLLQQPTHPSTAYESVVEAVLRAHVGVLQVDQRQFGM